MEEENLLEYRPSFERPERLATNWVKEDKRAENDIPKQEAHDQEAGSGIATELVKEQKDLQSSIEEKLKTLEKKYKDTVLNYDSRYDDDVLHAKEALGLTGNGLTIDDYRDALENLDTAAGHFLVEIIEDYIEGLQGNIELESYAEYFQLKQEMLLLDKYIEKILLSALEVTAFDFSQADWEIELLEKELQWYERNQNILDVKRKADNAHLSSYLYYPEKMERTRGQRFDSKKEARKATNRLGQANESVEVLMTKLDGAGLLFQRIEKEQSRAPYKETEKIISGLLESADTAEKWKENLTNFGLMLTLSVDAQNNEKRHLKNTLRQTYSANNREALLNELSVYNEVYQNSLLDTIQALDVHNEESKGAIAILLEQIVEGMDETHKHKKAKTKEMNTLLQAASLLQRKEITAMTKKDDARQGYHLLEKIKEQTEEKGMPTKAGLAEFLLSE